MKNNSLNKALFFSKTYAEMIRPEYPNLPQKLYPHMLRRTRACGLYQSGVELELVSRILGHTSTQTTRIYASPSIEMLKAAMENNSVIYPKQLNGWIMKKN